jgi:hypothetical protein
LWVILQTAGIMETPCHYEIMFAGTGQSTKIHGGVAWGRISAGFCYKEATGNSLGLSDPSSVPGKRS